VVNHQSRDHLRDRGSAYLGLVGDLASQSAVQIDVAFLLDVCNVRRNRWSYLEMAIAQ
jgi:hypothetical protein